MLLYLDMLPHGFTRVDFIPKVKFILGCVIEDNRARLSIFLCGSSKVKFISEGTRLANSPSMAIPAVTVNYRCSDEV